MQIPKINDRELVRMIDRDKLTQAAAARQMGVSRQAVSKRLQELRGQTTKSLAVSEKRIKRVVTQKINAIEQLHHINQKANELLTVAESEDDRPTLLRAMAEIRSQLELQLKIFATLYDLQAAEEFQEAVVTAIGDVAPDVRDKIIQRINEKPAVRQTVRFT